MSYEYWEKAMANPAALHAREFSITTTPEPGYYRTYRLHEPVAIWHETMDGREDQVIVIVNGIEVAVEDHENVWLSCAKNPVSEEWYRIVEAGGVWPDLDVTVSGIGHNRRRADDPESLIDEMALAASEYVSIDDDEMASRAMSLRSALLEQHKKVDALREAEKAPHLKAAKKVDEQWMHIVKRAKAGADYLRGLVETYETRKRRLAREAAAAAELKARLDTAEHFGVPLADVEVVPEPKAQIRSGYGRAVSVQTRMVVTGIKDIDEVLRWYRGDPRLHEALRVMAQEDVRQGNQVAGVIYEEQAVLR